MAKYTINKGIGRSPEFKGLKSQYLFIFAGGLLALFVVFVIMYMAGNTISIFPTMMVCMMAWRPIQALMAISASKYS